MFKGYGNVKRKEIGRKMSWDDYVGIGGSQCSSVLCKVGFLFGYDEEIIGIKIF